MFTTNKLRWINHPLLNLNAVRQMADRKEDYKGFNKGDKMTTIGIIAVALIVASAYVK